MTRYGQVGLHGDPSGPVLLDAQGVGQVLHERNRFDACGPQHGASVVACDGLRFGLGRHLDVGGRDVGDVNAEMRFDSDRVEGALGLLRQRVGERFEHSVTAVEQQNARFGRVDRIEFLRQRPGGEFPYLPGQFDSGGPSPGDGEGEPGATLFGGGQGLGHLECRDQFSSDRQGVVEGLHARCPLHVFVVAVIRLLHSDGNHEIVVRQLERRPVEAARRHHSAIAHGCHRGCFTESHLHVLLLAQQVPQRAGDRAFGEKAGCALIEQRLKDVRGASFENGDVDIRTVQPAGCIQPAEAAAEDQDPWT
ncbi:unannotated protein [freshwater metagenome]|uniref:Unannotated protein n=1 Tax=freshwater metagenome TaxID=449393 RepID=A0A6J7EFI7_9ZZZZ